LERKFANFIKETSGSNPDLVIRSTVEPVARANRRKADSRRTKSPICLWKMANAVAVPVGPS
jgi:hypothetical protein